MMESLNDEKSYSLYAQNSLTSISAISIIWSYKLGNSKCFLRLFCQTNACRECEWRQGVDTSEDSAKSILHAFRSFSLLKAIVFCIFFDFLPSCLHLCFFGIESCSFWGLEIGARDSYC